MTEWAVCKEEIDNMRIRRNKIEIIYGTIYPFDVMVSTETNFNKLHKFLIDKLPEESHDEIDSELMSSDGRTIMFSTGQTIIQINTLTPNIIAHEIFHAVFFFMMKINTPLNMDTNEAYAYLVGYLTGEIYKRFMI